MTIRRSLLFVHGRNFKPQADSLLEITVAALQAGLKRDYPDVLQQFDAMDKHIAWYGDVNAEILHAKGKRYDEQLDICDRRAALQTLAQLDARKRFSMRRYDSLPGKSALPEFMTSVFAPVASVCGLSAAMLHLISKDVAYYLDRNKEYGRTMRARVREQLCARLDGDDEVLLITHGTGCIVVYDVLWQLSHDERFCERYGNKKVDLWLTMGAPLGDSGIQKRLFGAREKTACRHPNNVVAWHNVAAEDDYTCHDNTLADDYRRMLQHRVVSAVHDHKVFNLAVRYGKSNPHSSIGYLVHPRVAKICADWLRGGVPPAAVSDDTRP